MSQVCRECNSWGWPAVRHNHISVCMKAYPLVWNNPVRYEKHIVLIGTFHLGCAYMKMVGKKGKKWLDQDCPTFFWKQDWLDRALSRWLCLEGIMIELWTAIRPCLNVLSSCFLLNTLYNRMELWCLTQCQNNLKNCYAKWCRLHRGTPWILFLLTHHSSSTLMASCNSGMRWGKVV